MTVNMDNVVGMIVQHVFEVAEAEDLETMQLVGIGASFILNVLLHVRPEIRSRIKEEIKADLLSILVDVEEYAAKLDGQTAR
jgi:hypothetical protein